MSRGIRQSGLAILLAAALGLCLHGQALFAQAPVPSKNTEIQAASPEMCRLLDDPATRNRMDGLLFNLLWSCGRQNELGRQPGRTEDDSFGEDAEVVQVLDVLVNNRAGETDTATTQSETSIAYNPVTGTYCSSFVDSWEFFGSTGGGGLMGFARSIDGGASWQDRGAVGSSAFGDPSLTWRRADGHFYLATLSSGGNLSVWRSTDDCGDFSLVSVPTTSGDDKEMLIADNNPSSPFYGTLYLVWTDFGVNGTPIRAMRSTNGGVSWFPPVNVTTGIVVGVWPAVAPNGDLYVAWLRYASFPDGNISVEVARSTNSGSSFTLVTSPLTDVVSPRDAAASVSCSRPSLNGNIRLIASPQIVVDASGTLHVVYSRDPDAFNAGDVINVYYRRSTDRGASWSTPLQLNDVSTGDQYLPSLQVHGTTLVAGWYDRRHDSANLLQDYYKRISTDGGLTWGANQRVTDASSPVHLDPHLALCYHGDYDQSVVTADGHVMQWSDDRNFVGDRNDPDVWTERVGTQAPPPPVAGFRFACTGLSCSFDGTGSTGTGITYAWSFGDSTSGSGSTASHLYGASGSFTVTLTVVDSWGQMSSRSRKVSPAGDAPLPAMSYFTVPPCRLIDTRSGASLASGQVHVLAIAGSCGIPATAKAAVLNVGAVSATGPGNLVFYPGDQSSSPFAASTLNFLAGSTPRFNNAVLRLATDGAGTLAVRPSVFATPGQVHLIIDALGYFSEDATPPPGGQALQYRPMTPCRLVDTRSAEQGAPVLAVNETRTFQVQGNCGVPVGAKAAVLNLVAISPAGPGNLSAFPSAIAPPLSSILNFHPSLGNLANGATVPLSTDPDDLAVRAGVSSTHVVIDVFGYFQ